MRTGDKGFDFRELYPIIAHRRRRYADALRNPGNRSGSGRRGLDLVVNEEAVQK